MTGSLPAHFEREGVSAPYPKNHRLRSAVHRYTVASRKGIEERLFTFAFSGLVYPQIWEDPVVDIEALALKPGEHLAAIASGGCNIVQLRDGRRHQGHGHRPQSGARGAQQAQARGRNASPGLRDVRALLRACQHLRQASRSTRTSSRRFSTTRRANTGRAATGSAAAASNTSPATSTATACSAASSLPATCWRAAHRRNPKKLLQAKDRADQIRIFNEELAPLFEKRHIKWLMDRPASLFGLGIPPSQFDALKGSESRMATVLRARLERLACGFDLKDNYFA